MIRVPPTTSIASATWPSGPPAASSSNDADASPARHSLPLGGLSRRHGAGQPAAFGVSGRRSLFPQERDTAAGLPREGSFPALPDPNLPRRRRGTGPQRPASLAGSWSSPAQYGSRLPVGQAATDQVADPDDRPVEPGPHGREGVSVVVGVPIALPDDPGRSGCRSPSGSPASNAANTRGDASRWRAYLTGDGEIGIYCPTAPRASTANTNRARRHARSARPRAPQLLILERLPTNGTS
jgi:hypothetical protein